MALLTRRDRGENKRNPTINLWLFGNGLTAGWSKSGYYLLGFVNRINQIYESDLPVEPTYNLDLRDLHWLNELLLIIGFFLESTNSSSTDREIFIYDDNLLHLYMDKLNSRPRKALNYLTPKEVFKM